MKLNATFRVPRYSLQRYQELLREKLGQALADSIHEWLGATALLIPVWSGASRATFRPLASKIGLQILISPRAFVDRTALGESNATGEVVSDPVAGRFSFTYSTTLAHLVYNEFNNANQSPDPTLFARLRNPGPYNFQESGQKAFREFAATVRLPDPSPAIVIRTIRV